jgi:hypothetical protein
VHSFTRRYLVSITDDLCTSCTAELLCEGAASGHETEDVVYAVRFQFLKTSIQYGYSLVSIHCATY